MALMKVRKPLPRGKAPQRKTWLKRSTKPIATVNKAAETMIEHTMAAIAKAHTAVAGIRAEMAVYEPEDTQ